MFMVPSISLCEPDAVQDFYSVHSKFTEKALSVANIMRGSISGRSTVMMNTSTAWRIKRKATSHAFYKNRMEGMLKCLKKYLFK